MFSVGKYGMKTKLAAIVMVSVALLGIAIMFLRTEKMNNTPTALAPLDLSDHPIYKDYVFGETDNIVNMGIQPLEVPPGVIAETMRRDAVLRESLSDQGLQIRFHPFLKGADINFFLQRGDIAVAMGGDMPTITAAVTSDVVIVTLTKLGPNSIVAREHMMVTDLRGKRVAYAFGSNAHYSLLGALADADLGEKDVHLIPLDVTSMPDALVKGEIDAFSAWEPTPTAALSRSDGLAVIHSAFSTSYMYFTRRFVEDHPEATRLIVASQLRGMRWMRWRKSNLLDACEWALQAGNALSGKQSILSAEQYAGLTQRDILSIGTVPRVPKSSLIRGGSLYKELEFLKALNKIPSNGDFSLLWDDVHSSFDSGFIGEVVTDPEKYQLDEYGYDVDGDNDE